MRLHTLPGGDFVIVGKDSGKRTIPGGEPMHYMVRLNCDGTFALDCLPLWSFPGAGRGERLGDGVPWPPAPATPDDARYAAGTAIIVPSTEVVSVRHPLDAGALPLQADAPEPPKRRPWGRK